MLSLEKILNESLWVAKMTWGRRVGTYEELKALSMSENCREIDLSANQPEHLKEFFGAMELYEQKNGWITIPDYYEIWVKNVA